MDDVMRLLFDRSAADPGSAARGGQHQRGIDGRAIEQAVETVCSCDVTPFFDAHVRHAAVIDFDRYLGLIGLKTRLSWGPAVSNGVADRDLRMYGFEPASRDSGLRLVVTNPASIWGRAGLHSRDRLVSIDGTPVATWSDFRARMQRLRLGDTVRVQVQRSSGPFEATVIVRGFERPTVRIERLPNATLAQRRLADAAIF